MDEIQQLNNPNHLGVFSVT